LPRPASKVSNACAHQAQELHLREGVQVRRGASSNMLRPRVGWGGSRARARRGPRLAASGYTAWNNMVYGTVCLDVASKVEGALPCHGGSEHHSPARVAA
jgi:hypothetical protein